MILPNTGITTSLVSSTIGQASNQVSTLCLSDKVNMYGFNSPDYLEQDKFFGKNPTERNVINQGVSKVGYPLGVFRGYDHNFVTFRNDEPYLDNTLSQFDGTIYVNLPIIPMGGTDITSTDHTFAVYFNRINDFTHTSHVAVNLGNNLGSYPNWYFTINVNNPPDGGAPLTPGSVVYFKIVHLSSPSRKWVGDDSITFPITLPVNPYSNIVYPNVYCFSSYISGTYYFGANIDIMSDTQANGIYTVFLECSTNSGFLNPVGGSVDIAYSDNKGNGGTPEDNGNGAINFSSSAINHQFSVGQTVYWHWHPAGTSSWQDLPTTTVTNTMPIDL
ncbi:hypothetical protein [uncultured Bacteroides sp.]|uniref:hypothetical protein n=1 Tax=uncultured Bacteroides sp. TaxID=162156 RepID=UPI002AA6B984|nr:hypothetical protein [uncultured Bacteroides sp.]